MQNFNGMFVDLVETYSLFSVSPSLSPSVSFTFLFLTHNVCQAIFYSLSDLYSCYLYTMPLLKFDFILIESSHTENIHNEIQHMYNTVQGADLKKTVSVWSLLIHLV